METGNSPELNLPGEGRSFNRLKAKMRANKPPTRKAVVALGCFLNLAFALAIFEVTNLEYLVESDSFDFLELFIFSMGHYKLFVVSFKL